MVIKILVILLFINNPILFTKTYTRNKSITVPESITNQVIKQTKNMNVKEIATYCNDLTNDLVTFSKQEFISPILFGSKGHCVTFASVCATLCNIAYTEHIPEARAFVAVGYFTVLGININKLISDLFPSKYKQFWINHDIVEIKYKDELLLIDPSINNLFSVYPNY